MLSAVPFAAQAARRPEGAAADSVEGEEKRRRRREQALADALADALERDRTFAQIDDTLAAVANAAAAARHRSELRLDRALLEDARGEREGLAVAVATPLELLARQAEGVGLGLRRALARR
jgi:hypothetical protein